MEFLHFKHKPAKVKDYYRLLISDTHADAPDFEKRIFLKDVEKITPYSPEQAQIFGAGDIFSLILPGDRKRHTNSRTPQDRDDLIDGAVEDVSKLLEPYADYFQMLGVGNHETSCIRFNHTDPVRRLIYRLNQKRSKTLPEIMHGGYEGIIRERFQARKTGGRFTFDIFYNHGQGGTSEVTKGMIDLDRYSRGKNTDIIWIGHKHTRVIADLEPVVSISSNNNLVVRNRRGIITGCYSKQVEQTDSHKDGYKISYGTERMRGTQSQRGVLLHHYIGSNAIETEIIS